jgi:hypothetical protein
MRILNRCPVRRDRHRFIFQIFQNDQNFVNNSGGLLMEYFLVLLKSKWKIYDNFLNFPKFTTKFVRSLRQIIRRVFLI